MSARRPKLVDCDPRWGTDSSGLTRWISFDCPEGHEHCRHVIPFSPALDGSIHVLKSAMWTRSGDTFETLSLSPSIARRPQYASREAAVEDGCIAELVTPSMLCAMHVTLQAGVFQFAPDSY